jgi:hypothetical protein
MINILSIDIDYAYAPSISLYDDDVTGSRICFDEQMKLLYKAGFDKALVNKQLLEQISQLLADCNRSTPHSKIQHHHEILELLPASENYTIYNIDHHHDVSYDDWHDEGQLDEGNWVEYAFENTNLKEYIWIRNQTSENLHQRHSRPEIKEIILAKDHPNNALYFPKFDHIIFCSSPHWTFGSGEIIIDELIAGWQNVKEIQTR